ncbi:MAG: pyruvate kinase [Cyanobacteria bacterium P01_H01_bin.74]
MTTETQIETRNHNQPDDNTSPQPLAPCLKRTRIIATLGPATENQETLKELVQRGVNVFRLNMSHGDASHQDKRIKTLQAIIAELDEPVALLADLQGPKIRTGELLDDTPVSLETGAVVTFGCAMPQISKPGYVATKNPELMPALVENTIILLDDGKIRLQVEKRLDNEAVSCRVVQGGMLESRKGINVPQAVLPIGALTEKDKEDALAVVKAGVDFIALSFVQRGSDITELRDFLSTHNLACPPVIAKIEKPQALEAIDAILKEADGLMVARGDLGVELPPEEVPVAQKQLVLSAHAVMKPIIVATQMLESMIHSMQPSRSDVSDIANAVFEGADAVMLSGETSVGPRPLETVSMMGRVIREAEKSIFSEQVHTAIEQQKWLIDNFYHAIAQTACYAALRANVKALVVFSHSGTMARRISKLKPRCPIIALTLEPKVCKKMAILWGVTPLLVEFSNQTDVLLENGEKAIFERNLLARGDSIVFCAGNTNMKGATNMLKIYHLGKSL